MDMGFFACLLQNLTSERDVGHHATVELRRSYVLSCCGGNSEIPSLVSKDPVCVYVCMYVCCGAITMSVL
jgi:hypothetical protein